jgi:hypothetical protein
MTNLLTLEPEVVLSSVESLRLRVRVDRQRDHCGHRFARASSVYGVPAITAIKQAMT